MLYFPSPAPRATDLRYLIPILVLFLAGCNMAAPGIGRIQAGPRYGTVPETFYDNSWANPYEDPVALPDRLPEAHLGIDLSERELGPLSLDRERPNGGYASAAERRQAERRAERRRKWREQYYPEEDD